jgi:hypothetical protein
VAQEVLGAGADEPLGERRGLRQEEPREVVERGVVAHAVELVDGRDDVEHRETLHGGVIERHAVGHAPPLSWPTTAKRPNPSRAMSSASSAAISRLL